MLNHLINGDQTIHIILGDFNINALEDSNNYVSEYLHQYQQVVDSPTHISGSLIDHVYVLKSLLNDVNVNCVVKNIYFSDHDAVKISLERK